MLQMQNSSPVCVLYIFVYIYTSVLGSLQSAQTSGELNQCGGSSADLCHVPLSPSLRVRNVNHTLALHNMTDKLSLQPIACFPT